jgi:hypothetical protein
MFIFFLAPYQSNPDHGQLENVPPDLPARAEHNGMLLAERGDHPGRSNAS